MNQEQKLNLAATLVLDDGDIAELDGSSLTSIMRVATCLSDNFEDTPEQTLMPDDTRLNIAASLCESVHGDSRSAGELERLIDIAPIGLCYLDTNFKFRYVNPWLAHVNGMTVEAHLGRSVDDLASDVSAGITTQLRRVLETGRPKIDGEVLAETPAHPGKKRNYRHSYFPDKNSDGQIIGICCVIQDVTEKRRFELGIAKRNRQLELSNRRLAKVLLELKKKNAALKEEAAKTARANIGLAKAKAELQRLALFDMLTSLGNRRLFAQEIEQRIDDAALTNQEFAILEMDLDDFKQINDTLGHAAGDEVLREFSARLRKSLEETGRTYRIGGDEFAAMPAARFGAFDHAIQIARQIAEAAATPMNIRGHSCSIGVSIGIAVYPQHGREPAQLLRKADAAMYEAKKKHLVLAGASDAGATTVLEKLALNA